VDKIDSAAQLYKKALIILGETLLSKRYLEVSGNEGVLYDHFAAFFEESPRRENIGMSQLLQS